MSLEASRGDAADFEAHSQTQDVSADWIGDFDGRAGVGQVAGVVRGAEVIEDNFVEQCAWCCREAPTPL